MALKRIGAKFEHYRVVEFDKYAIASYNAIHGTNFPTMDITKVHADDKALQEFTDNAKNMMLDTILILASVTLHDEFGFGRERLNRFKKRFNFKAECIGENYTDWNDQISILKEECGLEYSIRMNEKDARLK